MHSAESQMAIQPIDVTRYYNGDDQQNQMGIDFYLQRLAAIRHQIEEELQLYAEEQQRNSIATKDDESKVDKRSTMCDMCVRNQVPHSGDRLGFAQLTPARESELAAMAYQPGMGQLTPAEESELAAAAYHLGSGQMIPAEESELASAAYHPQPGACGSNLLVGCKPVVQQVPCSSSYHHQQYPTQSYPTQSHPSQSYPAPPPSIPSSPIVSAPLPPNIPTSSNSALPDAVTAVHVDEVAQKESEPQPAEEEDDDFDLKHFGGHMHDKHPAEHGDVLPHIHPQMHHRIPGHGVPYGHDDMDEDDVPPGHIHPPMHHQLPGHGQSQFSDHRVPPMHIHPQLHPQLHPPSHSQLHPHMHPQMHPQMHPHRRFIIINRHGQAVHPGHLQPHGHMPSVQSQHAPQNQIVGAPRRQQQKKSPAKKKHNFAHYLNPKNLFMYFAGRHH